MTTSRPRDYTHCLRAEWAHRFPMRPPKEDFDDQVLVALSFVMRQIDPDGNLHLKYPPGYAHGLDAQPTARPRGRPRKSA